MLDQAFRRLLQRYMEAHSAPMVQAMCSEIRSGPSDQEPRGCRAFCGAWGRTLTAAAQELTALQGAALFPSSLGWLVPVGALNGSTGVLNMGLMCS